MKQVVPQTLIETYSKAGGYLWELFDRGQLRNPMIEVFHEKDSKIYVRQDQRTHVDLITLTHGQAYDLMKALARALETPK